MSRDARKDGAAGAAPFIFENLQELIARFNQALGNSEFAAVHSIIDALFTIVIDDDEDGAPNPLEHRVDLLVQGMTCLAHAMYKECSSDRDSSTAQLISQYEAWLRSLSATCQRSCRSCPACPRPLETAHAS